MSLYCKERAVDLLDLQSTFTAFPHAFFGILYVMNRLSNALRKRHIAGYSIIELLIVIAIIGILVTLMYSVLARGKREARDAVRIDTMNTFKAGLDAYYSLHGMYPCGDSSIPVAQETQYNLVGGTADSPGSCPVFPPGHPELETTQNGFLNGIGYTSSGAPRNVPNCTGAAATKTVGLYGDGLFQTRCVKDPLEGTAGYTYLYVADSSRQNYILATHLEEYSDLMVNDGGTCDGAYEIGSLAGTVIPWWIGPNNICNPPS